MKLLRDYAITKNKAQNISFHFLDSGGNDNEFRDGYECEDCGWQFSQVALHTGRIRHFDECEYFNEDGIEE